MSLEREMKVVSTDTLDASDQGNVASLPVLRLAIATSDLKFVDEHFGSASRLAMYEVDEHSARFVGVCEFTDVGRDGDENKLIAKLEKLKGQHAVLSTAIGASAVRQLMTRNIQPIKLGEDSPIEEVLEYFQREIALNTTPWVRKALRCQTPDSDKRIEALLDQDWDESV